MMHYDLHEHYRITTSSPPTLPITQTLYNAAQSIEQAAGYQELMKRGPGKVLYGAWGTATPLSFASRAQNAKLIVYALTMVYAHLREQGYTHMLSRATSHQAPSSWQALGGGVPIMAHFRFANKHHKLYITAIDLRSQCFERKICIT